MRDNDWYAGNSRGYMIIHEIQQEAHEWALSKGWVDDRSFGDLLMLMVTELAEAYEEYRDNRSYTEIYYKDGKPEGIPIELADVVIRILNFCGQYNIDMEEALRIKMEYNKTRPYRHGGKRV